MAVTLVLTDSIAQELRIAALESVESAAVILARPVATASGLRLLSRTVRWVSAEHYLRREAYALSIASLGYVHALSEAERDGCVPIWFHTHPGIGSDPSPSTHDHGVDADIASLFRDRSGSAYYGALIVAPRALGFAFTGFVENEAGMRDAIDRVWIVGDRLTLIKPFGSNNADAKQEFDRSVRAFGPAIQSTLASLRLAVVGCGGTGSAVAEQLVRLGVRHITLIDPDVLSESNVTRVYGSRPDLVGQAKVDLLAKHLEAIAPDATVSMVKGLITRKTVAARLFECDVVFGCTDDNAGRLVLSRLSTYLLTPVFDCGVLLSSDADDGLVGIDGRVTTLVPGQGCLICRNRVDLARAAAESLPRDEHQRRVGEGYAPALGGIEPAVITFTTTVAALAVTELLERLIGFGDTPRPSELLYRGHDRQLSINRCQPRPGHYCDPDSNRLGLGMTDPPLEQTWPD